MIPIGEDGVTHINVYSKGKTFLGRQLSNWAHTPTFLDGKIFQSLEAYWYWLGVNLPSNHPKMIELQNSYGFKSKDLGRRLKKEFGAHHLEIFEDKIKKAMRQKVKQNLLMNSLKESSLPFSHYYEHSGKRVDAGYEWIVEEWEFIRREIKEGTFQ